MRVLIANGSSELRSCIRDILSDAVPEAVCLEAADRNQTLALLKTGDFSIALLDINIPGAKGLDLLYRMKCLYPKLPVILLGMQPEEQYEQYCLRAGADGYISLQDAPERLAQEITRALALEQVG
jgi:DNA-binding NarL/FixJ family response regulator